MTQKSEQYLNKLYTAELLVKFKELTETSCFVYLFVKVSLFEVGSVCGYLIIHEGQHKPDIKYFRRPALYLNQERRGGRRGWRGRKRYKIF